MSGAHYELTRTLCKSQSLPSICVLRDWLKILWAPRLACDANGDIGRAIKLFPIWVINCGATSALNYLHLLGLDTPAWVSAFAFDLWMLLEGLLHHICFTLFGLVSMLPFETRASLLLRRLKVLLCSSSCLKFVKDVMPPQLFGFMTDFGLINILRMRFSLRLIGILRHSCSRCLMRVPRCSMLLT